MNSAQILNPRVIRASAGTGKTRELSSRYIGLLALGEAPERILATTFTRKAAAEIRERIFARLAKAAVDESAAKELGNSFGNAQFLRIHALSLLVRLVRDQHRLQITTLDSFFISIAKSFALELGLPADWRIASSRDQELLTEEAVRKLFEHSKRAVTFELVRSLHGGASARSVHQQIVKDVTTLYGLYLFSNEAAWNWIDVPDDAVSAEWDSMVDRLSSIEAPRTAKNEPDRNWAGALQELHLTAQARKWKEFVENGLVSKILAGEVKYSKRDIPLEVQELVNWFIGQARREVAARLKLRMSALHEMLTLYHRTYTNTQRQLGALGFSDVKQNLARSAIFGELEQVYYRLDSRISHLLLDEFQDTSMTEWRIIQPIADEILSKEDGHSFFCVGDVKQAIYGWRGGVAEIFNTIEKRWPHVGAESNQTTYRCADAIVQFVNQLFAALPTLNSLAKYRVAVDRWCERFEIHSAARKELEGCVAIEWLPEEGPTPFERAVELVAELKVQYPEATIGILVRTNNAVSEMLNAFARSEHQIDVSEEGGNPLTDSSIVRLVLSTLRYLEHPTDSFHGAHLKETGFVRALEIPEPSNSEQALTWRNETRNLLLNIGYGGVISLWANRLWNSCAERDRVRLEQLIDLAYQFDSNRTLSTDDFFSFVSKEKIELPSEALVRVMNVHQSKGLEFDITILPELSQRLGARSDLLVERPTPVDDPERIMSKTRSFERDLIPEIQVMYEASAAEALSDNLSVLYVALTRSKQGMYIIAPEKAVKGQLNMAKVLSEAFSSSSGRAVVSGKEGWTLSAREREASEHQSEALWLAPVMFQRKSKHRKALLNRVTPSRLSLHSFNADAQARKLRGTLLHKFIEQVEWSEDFIFDEARLTQLGLSQGVSADAVAHALEKARRVLSDPRFAEYMGHKRLGGKDLLKVYREMRFAVQHEGEMVVGAIDRLVIKQHEGKVYFAEIIDFKSDEFEDSIPTKKYMTRYQTQLELYASAVRKMFGEKLEVQAHVLSLHRIEMIQLV